MTPERYQRLKSLFLAVCDRPAAEQAAVADALSDEELRGELLALLREHGAEQEGERFPAGTVLAGRYRVAVPLGAGGMGAVYRADDLTLGQPVALKFLNGLGGDDQLALLRHEVRVAREVTHANVCRVFDLVEGEAEPFLTMELVEGGSLADLLRQIGRLPGEKAADIARQLCEGLAAIHARGLLHRDLKPGNILLDDHGRVRIADFGLAGPAGTGLSAGTPAYMAPELLAGGAASVQSDLYALGSVLYEMHTGRPAFSERESRHEVANPSTWVDLDPRVERAVLRCLEADPARRPASALAVAAALPGGDPLAAALAAGETPDPTLVAASEGSGLSPGRARLVLVAVLAGLAAVVLLADPTLLAARVSLPHPPVVLVDRARQILRDLPPTAPILDRAHGLACDEMYLRQVLGKGGADAAPEGLERFWYRESPRLMLSRDALGMVTLDDPPRFQPGMRTVQLDGSGRLLQLELVPGERLTPGGPAPPGEVDALFRAAGLDRADFATAEPVLTPPVYADTRLAWTGTDPSRPGLSLRVEAASLAGQPVYFTVRQPWQDEEPDAPVTLAGWLGEPFGHLGLQAVVFVTLLAVAAWLAVRNVRAGRGDRHGARWLGGVVFATGLAGWLLMAHHLPSFPQEFSLFLEALGRNLGSAALVGLIYLALEPEVRRTRPQAEISWARLLAGRWRDPLVASHVLLGGLAGVALVLLRQGETLAGASLGLPLFFSDAVPMLKLAGNDRPLAAVLLQLPDTLLSGLLGLLALVLLHWLLRRGWLAGLALTALVTPGMVDWQRASLLTWMAQGLDVGLVVLALTRWGLLAALAALLFSNVLTCLPITRHLGAWYASGTLTVLAVLAALAITSWTCSRAGADRVPPSPSLAEQGG
jgi:serine/threonine-protein kinase